MAQILFVYLLTLAQWDVSGKAGEAPLPLPVGPDRAASALLKLEFTLMGAPSTAVSFFTEDGDEIVVRKSQMGITSRTLIRERDGDNYRLCSVRTSTAKNSKEIGKLFSYCLGTAWSCECLLPTTCWSHEFSARLRWFPMENVSLAAGIRSGFPSITLCISP